MSNLLPKPLPNLYAQPIARVCPTPELEARFVDMVQRFHAQYQPAIEAEVDLVNDMARAHWLMNYWKIRTKNSRRAMMALKKTEADSPQIQEQLAALEKEREHNQWHWIKQQLFLARRKKQFEESRTQYAQELAESGYTIDEARAYYLAHFTGDAPVSQGAGDSAAEWTEAA